MQKYFNMFLNKHGIFGSFLVKLRTKRMFSKIKGIFRYCNAKCLTDNLAAFVTQFSFFFFGSGPKNNNTIAETSECEWCSSTLLMCQIKAIPIHFGPTLYLYESKQIPNHVRCFFGSLNCSRLSRFFFPKGTNQITIASATYSTKIKIQIFFLLVEYLESL